MYEANGRRKGACRMTSFCKVDIIAFKQSQKRGWIETFHTPCVRHPGTSARLANISYYEHRTAQTTLGTPSNRSMCLSI